MHLDLPSGCTLTRQAEIFLFWRLTLTHPLHALIPRVGRWLGNVNTYPPSVDSGNRPLGAGPACDVDLAALEHLCHVVLGGTLGQEHRSRQLLAGHGALSQSLLNLL